MYIFFFSPWTKCSTACLLGQCGLNMLIFDVAGKHLFIFEGHMAFLSPWNFAHLLHISPCGTSPPPPLEEAWHYTKGLRYRDKHVQSVIHPSTLPGHPGLWLLSHPQSTVLTHGCHSMLCTASAVCAGGVTQK